MYVKSLFARTGLIWESIVNWYRDSVFYDLLAYFSERYFSVNFHIYQHIPLGPSANQSAQMIIIAVMLGLIFASIVMAIAKSRYGRFVKKLLKEECLSPEKSKTLSELGEFNNSSVRRALSRGNELSKCVYCIRTSEVLNSDEAENSCESAGASRAEGDTQTEKKPEMSELRSQDRLTGALRPDFTVARFYIPEDLKYRAELRFEQRGSGWLPVLLTVVLSVVGAALVCWVLPDFVQLLDNLISMTAPQ